MVIRNVHLSFQPRCATNEKGEPDAHDDQLKFNFMNSDAINPRDYTNLDTREPDILHKPNNESQEDDEVDMADQQSKDPEIALLISYSQNKQRNQQETNIYLQTMFSINKRMLTTIPS